MRQILRKRTASGLLALWFLLATATSAGAWDVVCKDALGVKCPDGFARAQTPWEAHPRAEHRELLETTLRISGLPETLAAPFELPVFAMNRTLRGKGGATYPSVRPVLIDAEREHRRKVSIPAMAALPDFSYTLWDLAAGNELCPPDPSPAVDVVDCHDYETHIGWLNSNHMLPQSRRWYEHLHALALDQAAECRRQTQAIPLLLLDRYEPYLLACEKQALMLEAVGHHYLQDSWAMGHMWERWGGTEIADFEGDRALGFAIGAFTGLIHGAKAVFDEAGGFKELGPWDDPMCAPHAKVSYVDRGVRPVEQHSGVGDIFLPTLRGEGPAAQGDRFGPQRRALLGCAVDGIREVYGATGQRHGPPAQPMNSAFDSSRSVRDDSCWAQRATNRAMAEGCGVHIGMAPDTLRFLPSPLLIDTPLSTAAFVDSMQPLLFAQLRVAPLIAGAPILLDPIKSARFTADASYACALAIASGHDPDFADDTDLASGGLPPLAGIRPNSFYARGNAAARVPPAFYADPFPPWTVKEIDTDLARRKEALNLFFADANAAQRCRDFSPTDLEDYVAAVEAARAAGADQQTIDARCRQCAQMIAPHLRHGVSGDHDTRREAFCGLVAPGDSAFIYSGEDPTSFTGREPIGFASLQTSARVVCGCEDPPPTPTPSPMPTPTPTTLGSLQVTFRSHQCDANVAVRGQVDPSKQEFVNEDHQVDPGFPLSMVSAAAEGSEVDGQARVSASGNGSASKIVIASAEGASVSVSIEGAYDMQIARPATFVDAHVEVRCQQEVTVMDAPARFSITGSGGGSFQGSIDVLLQRADFPFNLVFREIARPPQALTLNADGILPPGIYRFMANVSMSESVSSFPAGVSVVERSATGTTSVTLNLRPMD